MSSAPIRPLSGGDEQIVPTTAEIEQRDEKLVQFLSMAGPESEIDPEVAMEILAANEWDVGKAWEQLRGPDQAMQSETPERLPGINPEDQRQTWEEQMSLDYARRMQAQEYGPLPTSPMANTSGGERLIASPMEEFAQQQHWTSPLQRQEDEALRQAIENSKKTASAGGDASGSTSEAACISDDSVDHMDVEVMQSQEAAYNRARSNEFLTGPSPSALSSQSQVSDAERVERETQRLRAMVDRETRQVQDEEYLESLKMDRKREEEKQKRDEEISDAAAKYVILKSSMKRKREGLPPEPEKGTAGRVEVAARLFNGKRVQRAFLDSEPVSVLYDWMDSELFHDHDRAAAAATAEEEDHGQEFTEADLNYHLVSRMPRRVFDKRDITMKDAGIEN
ncbi:pre-rRNA processing and 40S ribosomal subunit assembly, partial [Perkinsus olseni]